MRAALALLLPLLSSAIDCSFAAAYPRQIIAYKVSKDLVIDGTLSDAAWAEVAFSPDFVDISTNTTPALRTNVKVRFDDTFLYVGARLEEPQPWANISWTCHCVSPADQVIFHDNDFEVFVDADGSNHFYKETEINAANANGTSATWDLCLNKPYDDGGGENSSRVFGAAGFDMQPPLHVRTFTDGVLNVPGSGASFWSAEIALPLAGLVLNTTARVPPRDGDQWRINFSRVEWAVKVVQGRYQKYPSCQSCPVPGAPNEDNWVFSPQGSIAMHLPERWAVLQFSEGAPNSTVPVRNAEWTLRSVAMALYYAQRGYAAAHGGAYASALADVLPYAADPQAIDGTCSAAPAIALDGSGGYSARIGSLDGSQLATIRDDRYLRVYAV